MEIHNIFGSTGSARPLSSFAQLFIISLIILGALFFINFSVAPFISEFDAPIVSDGIIIDSEGGTCVVKTDDEIAPKKLITNCDIMEGTNVSISYQKGSQYAKLVSQN